MALNIDKSLEPSLMALARFIQTEGGGLFQIWSGMWSYGMKIMKYAYETSKWAYDYSVKAVCSLTL